MTITSTAGAAAVRHLSIRVPWHDDGWRGTVCARPGENASCLVLPRIREEKDDRKQEAGAGKRFEELDQNEWPPCVPEHVGFMSPIGITRFVNHPYSKTSPAHAHFRDTPFEIPPYSPACVPFRWMRRDQAAELAQEYEFPFREELETRARDLMKFGSGWVQERDNQAALLDRFFSFIKPEESLCFFYAKRTPLSEETRRVLIGVGRVEHVGQAVEYDYAPGGELRSLIWERPVRHSIRPGFKDGFILPYHQILALAQQDLTIDSAEYVAYAPDDHFVEFAYASEHVSNDSALAALLSMREALLKAEKFVRGDWEGPLKWIDAQLADVWKRRGPYPGLGAALSAFGVDHGNLVAYQIASALRDNEDPWENVEAAFANPSLLDESLAKRLTTPLRTMWRQLPPDRKALLRLLARFDLDTEQAERFFVRTERTKAGIELTDAELLDSPYLLYERDRFSENPVQIATIDRGAYPDAAIRDRFPLPDRSALDGAIDPRRVRAQTMYVLEKAADTGSTLLPRDHVVQTIRDLPLAPECRASEDLMPQVEALFDANTVTCVAMASGAPAYQLMRLAATRDAIRKEINGRANGVRKELGADWEHLLDEQLKKRGVTGAVDEAEAKGRAEKVAALREISSARVSVLIGPAGTGKTTVLATLCQHPEIQAGGLRLLAPTGKARVQLQTRIGQEVSAQAETIAQFLRKLKRYDERTGRYFMNPEAPQIQDAKTVIIDEASMLTEEMLAAVISSLRGVQRLILAGDYRQLPPIGTGRPFVDIVRRLAPDDIEDHFPRVSPGYAELTLRHRQKAPNGKEAPELHDLLLADWFSGQAPEPAADEIWERIQSGQFSDRLKLVRWDDADDLHARLLDVLQQELCLASRDDVAGFEQSIGGELSNGWVYFNRGKTAEKAEAWQILSPVRGQAHGIAEVNRFVQRHFRSDARARALQRNRKVPKPFGTEEILYGDKVINTTNQNKEYVYPKDALKYVANGEIGVVVGHFRRANEGLPWKLEVEFSSQPRYAYEYTNRGFGDEGDAPLELAYAITVHRAQGSEFVKTILILPKDCRPLSRELLYTALTRQQERVVILHQGDLTLLKRYAEPSFSETARRLTNIFRDPEPVQVEPDRFLEEYLIHRTERGELVRSKAEVIIANLLHSRGIAYQYEAPLGPRFPDFTMQDDPSGRTVYWEHLGLLQDPVYRTRWERKLEWYRKEGIVPYSENPRAERVLVCTQDDPVQGIESQAIGRLMDEVFA